MRGQGQGRLSDALACGILADDGAAVRDVANLTSGRPAKRRDRNRRVIPMRSLHHRFQSFLTRAAIIAAALFIAGPLPAQSATAELRASAIDAAAAAAALAKERTLLARQRATPLLHNAADSAREGLAVAKGAAAPALIASAVTAKVD